MASFGFTPSGSPLGKRRSKKGALRTGRKRGKFGKAPAGPTNAPNQAVPDNYDPYEKAFRTSGGQ